MSYKITIIDNEDGEVLFNEENAVAVIGSVSSAENASGIAVTCCNTVQLLATLSAADKAKDELLENNPRIGTMYALKGLMDLCKSNSDDTNNA